MSYSVDMDADDVECYIPLVDIDDLKKTFKKIKIHKDGEVSFIYAWEEDEGKITGNIDENNVSLQSHQYGSFKNSSDGGLSILLEKYEGNGIVRETGEEGESLSYKYVKGVQKKGKIVFED